MRFETDLDERSVTFSAGKKLYSKDAVQIAAHIFGSRAEVYLSDEKTAFELTLKSRKKSLDKAGLEALGGEFLNELLNQEYRFVVGKFNQKVANLIVTQTMFAARGGEAPPKKPEGEDAPEFKAEVERLMREAADEIRKTMPKKIAPQGNVLPPAPEENA